MGPETDQQERGQTGQFPENHHQQQVAGQNNAQHGVFEAQKQGVELSDVLAFFQVIAGIQDNQEADDQDQQRKQQRQPVEPETEGNAQRRQPFPGVMDYTAASQRFPVGKIGRASCRERV